MAARRPIVSISGRRRQLPAGDTLPKEVLPALTASDVGAQPAVAGKGLSAEDYTTPEKTKLAGIDSGAQVNVGTNIAQGARTANSVVVTSSTGNNATLAAASTTLAGVMSASDKSILVALDADTGDLAPTLVNSFEMGASPLRYRKIGMYVHLAGQVNRAAIPLALTICTLPAGYRPTLLCSITAEVFGAQNSARVPFTITVAPSGVVQAVWASGAQAGSAFPSGLLTFTFSVVYPVA